VCWWEKSKEKWVACIGHKYLRYFSTLDEALEAQKKAQQEDGDVVAEPVKKCSRPIFGDDADDIYDL